MLYSLNKMLGLFYFYLTNIGGVHKKNMNKNEINYICNIIPICFTENGTGNMRGFTS